MDSKLGQIIEVEAVIIRADGTRKNLGVVSSNRPRSFFYNIYKYLKDIMKGV